MKHMSADRSGEAGYALAAVMILVFAMFIIGAGFFSLVGHEVQASQSSLDSQRAFWLAEGGNERALRYLSKLHSPPTADFYIYQNLPGPNGGTYTVHCAVDTTALWAVTKAFVLEGVGRSSGVERRVRQWVSMTSFAQYAMFTGEETINGNPIWYITGDVVEGRLHTNGTFYISGSPQFRSRVSSASDHMIANPNTRVYDMADWPVGHNAPNFAGGAELNAPMIPMPTDLPDLRQQGMFGGLYTGQATDIELGVSGATASVPAPGWLRYRDHADPTGDWASVRIANLTDPIFYCDGDVHIKGVLDGELTVASSRDVRVEDDIRYQASTSQGAPLAGCDDLLGLVAERNIVFVDNAANRTNLIVDAVLMALDTSISVENYSSGPPRGTLTIWGGLIQQFRGPVGQFSNNVIIHGYQKNYHYDPRVTGRTPPSYPLTGVYEKTNWEETWDVSDPF
jgi:cytoskeletal protein CcmA (bactofilin family)